MTGIFDSKKLKSDFEQFQVKLFKTNSFKYKIDKANKPELKKYHRYTYTLALIQRKLEGNNAQGNKFLFLKEIVSDLLSNSSIIFLGFHFSSQLVNRRIVENFYNHIYYFDHPIEFELLNLGKNEYTPILDLKKYLTTHPRITEMTDPHIKNLNEQIFEFYHNLCRVVHTKGHDFMGLAKNLDEIKPNIEIVDILSKSNKVFLNMIYVLFKFHRELEFSNVERDIIVKSFPKNMRSDLLG